LGEDWVAPKGLIEESLRSSGGALSLNNHRSRRKIITFNLLHW